MEEKWQETLLSAEMGKTEQTLVTVLREKAGEFPFFYR